MNSITEFDTIAAISTAVSNAGIGIIRISGDDALKVLEQVFVPYNKSVSAGDLEDRKVYYGNIVDDGEVIDECITFTMRGPHSYTAEDVAEIDCHGGVHVVYRVLEAVLKHGARPAEPGEFTKRAFLNGRIDLSQAEAVMDLIESKNELARKNSVRQLKGDLSEKIGDLRAKILHQTAYIEAAIDDPEHYDLDGYPEQIEGQVDQWINQVTGMLKSYDDGRLICEGIRTCIVGKPNAGKSSFLNTLLGEDRAIVTEVAGTTRDTLEESITIDGITLNIVDTAGIHETEDQVEKIGVKRAEKEIENADLILYIADNSRELSKEDLNILDKIKGRKKMILINKSDMDNQFDSSRLSQYIDREDPVIAVSAKYHQGIDEFVDALKKMMFHGEISTNDERYITNARHKKALSGAKASLEELRSSVKDRMPEDFYTIDMMNAYEKLGLIIGESVEEDLVNEIFHKFCMGK